MQLIIDLTPEQEAALNYVASKGNKPATDTEPAVIVKPDEYLRARFDAVLASYVEQAQGDDTQALVEAFASASDADRDAVFSALKAERPTTTATAEVTTTPA
jgi:hypothetical protein